MLRLPKQSRPVHFLAFALAAFVWGLFGPDGWVATAAFVVAVFAWMWLARRSLRDESVLGAYMLISSTAFVLGVVLVLAMVPALLLRQHFWP